MIAAEPLANAVRFPPRLQMVSVQTEPKSALDALLSAGKIDDHQHAAAVAYRTLRQQFENATRSYRHRPGGASMPETAFPGPQARPRRPAADRGRGAVAVGSVVLGRRGAAGVRGRAG